MEVFKGRLKVKPEDFQVEEVLDLEFDDQGPYSYYLLWKRGMNTMAVLDTVSRRWKVTRDRMGFCGLKDKRAVTTQYISIAGGPEEDLEGENFRLTFLGKGSRPLQIGDAAGNVFTVRLRNVSPREITEALSLVREIGFVNYFGEQRFASDLSMEKPMLRYLLEGDFETALREYFAHHPLWKRSLSGKRIDWKGLLAVDGVPAVEKAVLRTYLRKGDAERALRVLPKPVKLLFFFSYQSLLWNRAVSRFVRRFSPSFCVPFVRGEVLCFYTDPGPLLSQGGDLMVPFISKEAIHWDGPAPLKEEILRVVEEEGIVGKLDAEVLGLKVFSPGQRRLIATVRDLKVVDRGKRSLTLRFFLASGSYATVFLLKVLTFPKRFTRD